MAHMGVIMNKGGGVSIYLVSTKGGSRVYRDSKLTIPPTRYKGFSPSAVSFSFGPPYEPAARGAH